MRAKGEFAMGRPGARGVGRAVSGSRPGPVGRLLPPRETAWSGGATPADPRPPEPSGGGGAVGPHGRCACRRASAWGPGGRGLGAEAGVEGFRAGVWGRGAFGGPGFLQVRVHGSALDNRSPGGGDSSRDPAVGGAGKGRSAGRRDCVSLLRRPAGPGSCRFG